MRKLALMCAVLGTLILSACGGDETLGQPGDGSGGTVDVNSVVLLASSAQLSSGASDPSAGVTLTAIVKDDNNRVVAGVPVEFSASGSAELNVGNPAITDANGRVTAILTTGGDSQNRDILVRAAVNGLSASQTISIVGSLLNVTGPDSAQANGIATYTVLVTDSSGNGVSGETVTASATNGASVAPFSKATNSAGVASFDLTMGTQDTVLTVSALGQQRAKSVAISPDQLTFISGCVQLPITALNGALIPLIPLGGAQDLTVDWQRNGAAAPSGTPVNFGATRGTVNGVSFATVPLSGGQAPVSVSSAQAGFSTITASSEEFSKPSVKCVVQFVSTTPTKISVQGFPANLSINQSSDITVILRDDEDNPVANKTIDFTLLDSTAGELSASSAVTNSLGIATVTYNATSLASATDGVRVTGTVRGTSLSDTAVLTVGGRAVNITLGTGSAIIVKDISTYQDAWTVLVNDPSGNPVPDAEFTLSVRSIAYYKGPRSAVRVGDPVNSIICPNEDLNYNDFFDVPGADIDVNGNGMLEPGRVAAVPNTLTLDDDGSAQFLVTYAKEFGEYVRVELVATARVAGSETTERRQFWLRITETDADNLPEEGPFGVVPICETTD